jgi:hypothetical protein
LWIRFIPQFGIRSPNGRSLREVFGTRRLSARREFANVKHK